MKKLNVVKYREQQSRRHNIFYHLVRCSDKSEESNKSKEIYDEVKSDRKE